MRLPKTTTDSVSSLARARARLLGTAACLAAAGLFAVACGGGGDVAETPGTPSGSGGSGGDGGGTAQGGAGGVADASLDSKVDDGSAQGGGNATGGRDGGAGGSATGGSEAAVGGGGSATGGSDAATGGNATGGNDAGSGDAAADADAGCTASDPQVGKPCTVPSKLGPCAVSTYTCVGGRLTCDQVVFPGTEICDGIDNDCNGTPDDNLNDPMVGADCTVKDSGGTPLKGECAKGKGACQNGGLVCSQIFFPGTEICDGLDNDCNGTVDDNLVDARIGAACTASGATGECAKGTTVCSGGAPTCAAGTPKPEVCNGLDDNCNNTPDDLDQSNNACKTANPSAKNIASWSCGAGPSYPCQYTCATTPFLTKDLDGLASNGCECAETATTKFVATNTACVSAETINVPLSTASQTVTRIITAQNTDAWYKVVFTLPASSDTSSESYELSIALTGGDTYHTFQFVSAADCVSAFSCGTADPAAPPKWQRIVSHDAMCGGTGRCTNALYSSGTFQTVVYVKVTRTGAPSCNGTHTLTIKNSAT